jgi:hypothetical protein
MNAKEIYEHPVYSIISNTLGYYFIRYKETDFRNAL